MSKELSVGFQIYFYQLFSRELGIGKQTLIARFDEALKNDNLVLADLDLDCSSTQELLEMMPSCIKLTIFKGGRVYATVLRVPEWDEALAKTSKNSGKEGKSFKRKKSSSLKPVRPRVRKKKPQTSPEKDTNSSNANNESDLSNQVAPLESIITNALLKEANCDNDSDNKAIQDPSDSLSEDEEEITQENKTPDAQEVVAPSAPDPDRPHLTITFDPSKDMSDPFTSASSCSDCELVDTYNTPADTTDTPCVCCETVHELTSRTLTQPVVDNLPKTYPHNFTDEVHCSSSILGLLSRIIPFGGNLAQILNEDWDYARATGAVNGSATRATFPLRYVHEDGITPIYLTIHRSHKMHKPAQWSLLLIDGKNASEFDHKPVCFAGLPRADVSSFEQLSPCACFKTPCSPERAFTTDCSVGSWNEFLSAVANLAAPERWSFNPKTRPFSILREYLCATYLRLKQCDLLYISAEKDRMAFNTGLFTLSNDAIYAWFNASNASTPWVFDCFKTSTMSAEELDGVKLVAASYIDSLRQTFLAQNATLTVDTKSILAHSLSLIPLEFLEQELADDKSALNHIALLDNDKLTVPERNEILSNLAHYLIQSAKLFRRFDLYLTSSAQKAFVRAKSNYRSIATAFDPTSSEVKLLLPLGFTSPHLTEVALVIRVNKDQTDTYSATSLLSLPCAYVCARTTAQDMPSWLNY